MNDRRRALLSGGFAQNYIFKQGLGLREDIAYGWTTNTPYVGVEGGSIVTKNSISVAGGTEGLTFGIIYMGSKIEYNSKGRLLKNAISVENFTKIYFRFYVDNSNSTVPAYINLINCSKLPNAYVDETPSTPDAYRPDGYYGKSYYHNPNSVHKMLGVSTASGEYTISFDISAINEIMISVWSGNQSGRNIAVYDIWLE